MAAASERETWEYRFRHGLRTHRAIISIIIFAAGLVITTLAIAAFTPLSNSWPFQQITAATDGLDGQLTEANAPLGKTFLDEIKLANRRLGRVVGNLLDMTRIETGRLPLNLEWCEPPELLRSALEQLSNEIPSERVQVLAPETMPLVRLDSGLMEQALCNLLSNAAAYSPVEAPIRLSAQMDGQTLMLRVTDRGIGLLPGEDKKVFEKFYRGPQARPGGTGLGLSIVQGFVRAHGGTIAAENNPDGGAIFTIRIPVETAKASVA